MWCVHESIALMLDEVIERELSRRLRTTLPPIPVRKKIDVDDDP